MLPKVKIDFFLFLAIVLKETHPAWELKCDCGLVVLSTHAFLMGSAYAEKLNGATVREMYSFPLN